MKKGLFIILLTVLGLNKIHPQSYLENFPGIPIITYGWGTNDDWILNYNYNKVKEMGTDIFIAPNLSYHKFDLFRQANLKLIPYQTSTTLNRVDYITRYTDAIYNVWEAESVPISQGELQLTRDLSKVDEILGGIRTKNNDPGYIIEGPNYIQPEKYTIEQSPIQYSVKFRLKVEPNGGPVSLQNNTDNICRIEVTSKDNTIVDPKIIQAWEFGGYNTWQQFEINYAYQQSLSDNPATTVYINNGAKAAAIKVYPDIEFKVYFYGTTTNYIKLCVDNVIVADEKGNELFTNSAIEQSIIAQANNTNNSNNFTSSQTDFENAVVGWYAVDEPSFIDQWACVKRIAELIKNNTSGKKLITSIAGNWNGKIFDNSNIYRIDELLKRTNLEEVIMDNFIFDYPYNDDGQPPATSQSFAQKNIENMLLNHLDRLNDFQTNFILNLQVGK